MFPLLLQKYCSLGSYCNFSYSIIIHIATNSNNLNKHGFLNTIFYHFLPLGTFSRLLTTSSSEVSHRNIFLYHFFLSDQYFFIIFLFLMRFHFLDLTFKKFNFYHHFAFKIPSLNLSLYLVCYWWKISRRSVDLSSRNQRVTRVTSKRSCCQYRWRCQSVFQTILQL